MFDSEGVFTKEIFLINNNFLDNILSNKYFSKLLHCKNTGNASFLITILLHTKG